MRLDRLVERLELILETSPDAIVSKGVRNRMDGYLILPLSQDDIEYHQEGENVDTDYPNLRFINKDGKVVTDMVVINN